MLPCRQPELHSWAHVCRQAQGLQDGRPLCLSQPPSRVLGMQGCTTAHSATQQQPVTASPRKRTQRLLSHDALVMALHVAHRALVAPPVEQGGRDVRHAPVLVLDVHVRIRQAGPQIGQPAQLRFSKPGRCLDGWCASPARKPGPHRASFRSYLAEAEVHLVLGQAGLAVGARPCSQPGHGRRRQCTACRPRD